MWEFFTGFSLFALGAYVIAAIVGWPLAIITMIVAIPLGTLMEKWDRSLYGPQNGPSLANCWDEGDWPDADRCEGSDCDQN